MAADLHILICMQTTKAVEIASKFFASRAGGLTEGDMLDAVEELAARIDELKSAPRVNAAFQKFLAELEQHINEVES